MKLISESAYEDQLIPRLVSLLRDLKVDAHGFRTEDAFAPLFWSADDFTLELSSIKGMTKEEITAVLAYLEPDLLEATILAGFDVIENYLRKAKGAVVYQNHRSLQ